MKELTYATVCSGIECMSVAAWGLPLKPVFFSEIEPFPCAVLKAHYPEVPNFGDMSKIQVSENGKEITNGTTRLLLGARLDILAGGTPCQDVSVAGKRAGMQEGSGTRSSLAFEFVRLARELRPRWVIWENVAVSIDSKNAPDFLRFASALGDCGYSLAWRVLDAQYVRVDGMERAVPQRRRRVWVVGCLGADESIPAQILFEPDCAQGHTPPRRRTGQGFAYSLEGRDQLDARLVGETFGVRLGECQSFGRAPLREIAPTLTSETHAGDNAPACIALDGDKLKPREDQRKGGNGFGINEDGAGYTLTGVDRHGVAYENDHLNECEVARSLNGDHDDRVTDSGTSVVHTNSKVAYGISFDASKGFPIVENAAQTQISGNCPGHRTGVATIGFKAGQSMAGSLGDEREVAPTLSHRPSGLEPTAAIASDIAAMRYIVRRLTPTECERLMGLPDGYTIPVGLDPNDPALVAEFQRIFNEFGAIMAEYAHTKPPKPKSAAQVAAWLEKIADPETCPDSPRYKACGNGWATNQPRWILCRMLAADGIDPFERN